MRRMGGGRRSGFVTIFAVTLIALVAVALAALTARLNTLARQRAQDRERAQVEELVAAGLRIAARGTPTGGRSIELPERLKEQGASLKLTPHEGNFEVEAVVGRTRLTQRLPR